MTPAQSERRTGHAALACVAASVALVAATGLLGPSAAAPPLPGRGPHPPYWIAADPSPWLVTGLLLAAVGAGAAGLLLGLRALDRGWRPTPRRLLAGSVLAVAAVVLVPPMGSADHLVYAAYGRIAALGGSPYTETPRQLAERGDPVGLAVEAPWQDAPSIYGPLGTAEQWLAARLGGESPHAIVWWLTLFGAAAFGVTGWLLQRLAGPDEQDRARAALLWSLNPLLLLVAVNGAHIDTFGVVWAVAALLAVRRPTVPGAVAAGVLVALACAVKLSFGLVVLALAWALRRHPARLAGLLIGGLVVGALAYLPVGLSAFDQLRTVSRLVSFGSAWRAVVGLFEALLGEPAARTLISLLAWALLAVVARALARGLPWPRRYPDGERTALEATRTAAILGFAWLLTAPYTLPWYDVIAWAPFAVLAASWYDRLLVLRTAVLAAGYVPGRVVPLPDPLGPLTMGVRGVLGPAVGLALLALVLLPRRVTRR